MIYTKVLAEQQRAGTRVILEQSNLLEGRMYTLKVVRHFQSETAAQRAYSAEIEIINPKRKGGQKK